MKNRLGTLEDLFIPHPFRYIYITRVFRQAKLRSPLYSVIYMGPYLNYQLLMQEFLPKTITFCAAKNWRGILIFTELFYWNFLVSYIEFLMRDTTHGLLLVKCYDKKKVIHPSTGSWLPLTQPKVVNQQKKVTILLYPILHTHHWMWQAENSRQPKINFFTLFWHLHPNGAMLFFFGGI